MTIKNICCIGAGYVGGPTMAVIALKCPEINITVVDDNREKIEKWNGQLDNLPVYEPGLSEIIKEVRGKNLFFSNNISSAIEKSEMIFMAVNTPTKSEGEGAGMAADLSHVVTCAKYIAKYSKTNKIVIEKSTLPVRTAEKIKEILSKYSNSKINYDIISNPEFLAEGTAINDLFKSDRVLIGGDSSPSGRIAVQSLVDIYSKWIPVDKILTTNVWSSELTKLASNAMLAQRISSINSLSALCEKTGADIEELSVGIGMDRRIGPHFLKASVGFGGSCFKKDILNLVYLCQFYGLNEVADFWIQVVKINDYQKQRFVEKINRIFKNSFSKKTLTILGWAFKANTNDSRESPSIYISKRLLKLGAKLKVFDPMVPKELILKDIKSDEELELDIKKVTIKTEIDESLFKTDAVVILTEWELFKNIDWTKLISHSNNKLIIFDGRNILNDKLKYYKNYFSL